jgi:hypothetical protein
VVLNYAHLEPETIMPVDDLLCDHKHHGNARISTESCGVVLYPIWNLKTYCQWMTFRTTTTSWTRMRVHKKLWYERDLASETVMLMDDRFSDHNILVTDECPQKAVVLRSLSVSILRLFHQ